VHWLLKYWASQEESSAFYSSLASWLLPFRARQVKPWTRRGGLKVERSIFLLWVEWGAWPFRVCSAVNQRETTASPLHFSFQLSWARTLQYSVVDRFHLFCGFRPTRPPLYRFSCSRHFSKRVTWVWGQVRFCWTQQRDSTTWLTPCLRSGWTSTKGTKPQSS